MKLTIWAHTGVNDQMTEVLSVEFKCLWMYTLLCNADIGRYVWYSLGSFHLRVLHVIKMSHEIKMSGTYRFIQIMVSENIRAHKEKLNTRQSLYRSQNS